MSRSQRAISSPTTEASSIDAPVVSAVVSVTYTLSSFGVKGDVSRRPEPKRRTRRVCDDRRVFSIEDRDRVREHVLALAEADPRVVAAAVVGGLADGAGDRWSDLDLTFAVADTVPLDDVLE